MLRSSAMKNYHFFFFAHVPCETLLTNGDFQWTQEINNKPCLLKDMKMLPGVTVLNLDLISNGHAFGASLFHVLRLCSGTRKLTLHISSNSLEVKLSVVYIMHLHFSLLVACLYFCCDICSSVLTMWLIYVL